jgi:hypothetical protein
MMAESLRVSWQRVTQDIVVSAWDIFEEGPEFQEADEPDNRVDDREFQIRMTQQDLDDLEWKQILKSFYYSSTIVTRPGSNGKDAGEPNSTKHRSATISIEGGM